MFSWVRWSFGFVVFIGLVGLSIGVTGALVAQLLDTRLDPAVLSTVAGAIGVGVFLGLPWWFGRRVDKSTAATDSEGTSTYGAVIVASIVGLVVIVGLAPNATRRALAHHGDWFLGGTRNTQVLAWGRWLGEYIPRSQDPGPAMRPGDEADAEPHPPTPADAEAFAAKDEPEVSRSPAPRKDVVRDRPPSPDAAPGASNIFTRGAPSVVVLETQSPIEKDHPFLDLYRSLGVELEEGYATGFIVEPGVIVTAYHVVQDVERAQITLHDGRIYRETEVLASDHERDIAILRAVEPLVDVAMLPLAEPGRVAVGQPLYAIGNPGRLDYSLSVGMVGALRTIHGTKLIQSQAPVSFGSSGGPMLDEQGRVVGVVTHAFGQAQNLAVELEHVVALLRTLPDATPRRLELFEPQPTVVQIDDTAGVLSSVDKFQFEGYLGLVARAVDRCLQKIPSPAKIELALNLETGFMSDPLEVRTDVPETDRNCMAQSKVLWSMLAFSMQPVERDEPFALGLEVEGIRGRYGDERPRSLWIELSFASTKKTRPDTNGPLDKGEPPQE